MDPTQQFLAASTFAVAGASQDRAKYGNKVFRALVASGRTVFPVNPTTPTVEGHTAFPSVADAPEAVESLSIVTPPIATHKVVAAAIEAGVKHVWMQPGAEDEEASRAAREAGMTVIDDGSCVLVSLAVENRSRSK